MAEPRLTSLPLSCRFSITCALLALRGLWWEIRNSLLSAWLSIGSPLKSPSTICHQMPFSFCREQALSQ